MGDFYVASDILIRGRHIKSVIICSRADFSWGDIYVTPALARNRCRVIKTCLQYARLAAGSSHSVEEIDHMREE